jgi:DnaJ-class molecular chaperone
MAERSYYRLLQVDPAAEDDVIRAAHRVLAARLHPETDISGVAEYRMRELNRALAILTDPAQRRTYDEQLAAHTADNGNARVPVGPGQSHSLADRVQGQEPGGIGDTRLDFGRYAGFTLGELANTDPDYLRWLSRHSSGIRYRGAIMRLLADREAHRRPLRVSP